MDPTHNNASEGQRSVTDDVDDLGWPEDDPFEAVAKASRRALLDWLKENA